MTTTIEFRKVTEKKYCGADADFNAKNEIQRLKFCWEASTKGGKIGNRQAMYLPLLKVSHWHNKDNPCQQTQIVEVKRA
jgi:hypothetical protein